MLEISQWSRLSFAKFRLDLDFIWVSFRIGFAKGSYRNCKFITRREKINWKGHELERPEADRGRHASQPEPVYSDMSNNRAFPWAWASFPIILNPIASCPRSCRPRKYPEAQISFDRGIGFHVLRRELIRTSDTYQLILLFIRATRTPRPSR